MTSFAAETPDPGFADPLRKARSLHLARAVILAAAWSLACALLALKFSGLVAAGADPRLVAGAAFILVFAVGLFVAVRTTPSLLQLARQADDRFGLGERLSTALSLETAPQGWRGAIEAGLRRDAAAHAGAVDAWRLEPLAGWSTAAAVFALAIAIGIYWLLPTPSPAPLPAPAATSTVDSTARSQNLETIADTISADAKARQNDYLQAVSDAVSRLADASQPGLSDADYNKALTDLLDHARLAYGKAQPAWLRGDAAFPADPFHLAQDGSFAALAQSAKGQADDGRAGGGEEMVPELLSEQNLQANVPAPPSPAGRIKLAPDTGDMALNNQNVGGNTNSASSISGKSAPAAPGGAPPSLDDTKPTSLGDITGAAGIPLGAATQSGAGASRVAGAGTQALDDPSRHAAAPIASSDQVMLPADQYRQGKRIRIEVTPGAGGSAATDGPGASPPITADGHQTPVIRGVPSVRDQAMFARYFTHGEAS